MAGLGKASLRTTFAVLLSVFGTSLSTTQTTVTIGALKDNTLIEDTAGSLSNGSGPVFHAGRVGPSGQGTIRRGLIAFDVASQIPSGATVLSVVLTLNMSQTNSGAQTVTLHRLLSPWGEGTSSSSGGGGDTATLGDATWLHTFYDSLFWSSPGGDFSPTLSASQSVAGTGAYTWGSTAGMVSDVQRWVDTPSTNYGWALVGNESALQTAKRFDSRDNVNPSLRPLLQVTYDVPVQVGDQSANQTSFVLLQNYPNPFNPSTVIRYTLPATGYVTLKVYNILGQEVAVLVDEMKQPGRYEVEWNAAGFPSGLYVYRLQARDFVDTKKLVLLK